MWSDPPVARKLRRGGAKKASPLFVLCQNDTANTPNTIPVTPFLLTEDLNDNFASLFRPTEYPNHNSATHFRPIEHPNHIPAALFRLTEDPNHNSATPDPFAKILSTSPTYPLFLSQA